MDVLTAIKERRSCRNFSDEPIDRKTLEILLEAATQAPSPLNAQPWRFVVITGDDIKSRIVAEAEKSREWAVEKSGWGWLGKYDLDFLRSVPAIIAVAGIPKNRGWTSSPTMGPKPMNMLVRLPCKTCCWLRTPWGWEPCGSPCSIATGWQGSLAWTPIRPPWHWCVWEKRPRTRFPPPESLLRTKPFFWNNVNGFNS
jgi:hypothetical protein